MQGRETILKESVTEHLCEGKEIPVRLLMNDIDCVEMVTAILLMMATAMGRD